MIKALSHLNIVVDDVEYATEFYGRTLGFETAINSRGQMNYPAYRSKAFARNAGLEDVDLDIRFLRHPVAGIYLELMHYRVPQGNVVVSHRAFDQGGIRHVAWEVDDIDAVFVHLCRQPDVRILKDPNEAPEALPGSGIKFFYWMDPWKVQWEMESGRPVGLRANSIVG